MVLNLAASVMYNPAPDVARVASSSLFARRIFSSDSSPPSVAVLPGWPNEAPPVVAVPPPDADDDDAVPPTTGAPGFTLL